MDHLPHPQDATILPVTVPYYNKYKYDGGSFTDYPLRCGFDKRTFMRRNFRTVPSNDHDSFFQAWLFFGLIHHFFRLTFDDNVDNYFINVLEQRVTTCWLPLLTSIRIARVNKLSQSERTAEYERVGECLREVQEMIVILDEPELRENGLSHVSEEVSLSIAVLGVTFELGRRCFLNRNVTEIMLMGVWPRGQLALKRLREGGWCESEVTRLATHMTSCGLLYCGSMPRFGRTIDHSGCSEEKCAAEDINEETYETAHAEECEDHNECEHHGPSFSDLKDALVGKSFPVIKLEKSETTSDIHVDIVAHRNSMSYTAITHVWADGLGNPHGNTLPQCQILRLYQLVQSLNRTRAGMVQPNAGFHSIMSSSSKTSTVYLWIDTFCVPVDKELRKRAIESMYDVYDKAKSVLVLDRSLYTISAERPAEEVFLRIVASPWMRRAWTFQEGVLAKFGLFVQFADRAIDVGQESLRIYKQIEEVEPHNLTLVDSCSPLAFLHFARDTKDPDLVHHVLQSLKHRSTSHPEDKLICFAIMMRFYMRPVLDAEGDIRTQEVLKQLESIPRSFLWHSRAQSEPTLNIPGFRWAPRNIFSVEGLGATKDDLELGDRGLLVEAEGLVLWGLSLLMTRDTITEKFKRNLYIKDINSGRWYTLGWFSPESFDFGKFKTQAKWIVLAVILKPTRITPPQQEGAIIRLDLDRRMATPDKLPNYLRQCNTISGEYICKGQFDRDRMADANVEQEFDKEWGNDIIMFRGEMRGSSQMWCVT